MTHVCWLYRLREFSLTRNVTKLKPLSTAATPSEGWSPFVEENLKINQFSLKMLKMKIFGAEVLKINNILTHWVKINNFSRQIPLAPPRISNGRPLNETSVVKYLRVKTVFPIFKSTLFGITTDLFAIVPIFSTVLWLLSNLSTSPTKKTIKYWYLSKALALIYCDKKNPTLCTYQYDDKLYVKWRTVLIKIPILLWLSWEPWQTSRN